MKHTRIALTGVALAALTLAGCSATPQESPSGDGDARLLATVEDTLFGPIEIPEPEDGELTVVALGWSDAEVALALGVTPVAVYDWIGFGEDLKGVGPWAVDAFGDYSPTIIQDVGDALDYETIQSLDPDLILNTNSGGDEEQFQRLSTIAPTVFGPEGSAGYVTGWRNQTLQVATALGKTADGEALVATTEELLADAAAEHPEFSGLSAVSASKFGDAYGAGLPGDFRWDLLEDLGFTLYGPVADLDATGFYAPISIEQISVLDADVAVMFPIGYTADELRADPLISSLPVVADGRMIVLDPEEELVSAFSVASVLSIPIAVEGLVPRLADIVAG